MDRIMKKKNKLPGDIGMALEDVAGEEFDYEGLPVIHIEERKSEKAKAKRQALSVRVNAVKTRIPLAGGRSRWAYEQEIIDDPCPELLEMAEKDPQHRLFTILK